MSSQPRARWKTLEIAVRERQHAPAIVCVGKVTSEQREQQKRSNLHESDIAENDGRPGLEVEIPTHGDREHLESEARQEISGQKQAIIAEAE